MQDDRIAGIPVNRDPFICRECHSLVAPCEECPGLNRDGVRLCSCSIRKCAGCAAGARANLVRFHERAIEKMLSNAERRGTPMATVTRGAISRHRQTIEELTRPFSEVINDD